MYTNSIPNFDVDEFLKQCVDDATSKIKRDLTLYKEYYYSGLSIEDFASVHGVPYDTIPNIRKRYGLPRISTNKNQQRAVERAKRKGAQLCNNPDCDMCAFLAKLWRIERKVVAVEENTSEVSTQSDDLLTEGVRK